MSVMRQGGEVTTPLPYMYNSHSSKFLGSNFDEWLLYRFDRVIADSENAR